MINEPTLEHYIYYLRRVEGDKDKDIQERRAAFGEELKAFLIHLERLSGQPIPAWEWPQESQDRRVSQRIVRTDWLDNQETGRSCFVEARTYGDVYWLQVGYYQQGQTGPGIFTSLRDEAWRPSATEHLLGSSAYLCGIATDKMDELAAQALAAYTGDSPGVVVSTHLADCCAGLYGSNEHPRATVVLYPNAECEDWAGRTILNDIALRLEMYRHKADRQLAWCEQNYLLLSEQERALRDFLDGVSQVSPVNPELVQRLVRLYRVFNGNVGMLAERQVSVGINLDNLDIVLAELGPLVEDRLLSPVRDHLRRRQRQLEADLTFADQSRQQAGSTINALRAALELDRMVDLQADLSDVASIGRPGWPGTLPPSESEIPPLAPPSKPPQPLIIQVLQSIARFLGSLTTRLKHPQPVTYPQVNPSPLVSLATWEKSLLRHVYQGFGQVLVERRFSGGYSGAQVLLTLPIASIEAGGLRAARKVTKLGSATELRRERDNYARYVGNFLPSCVAQVESERYYEQRDRAGLNYRFVGGGVLGQAVDLEEYYHSHTAEQVIKTLDGLLDKELGQHWCGQTNPLNCFFTAEYGRHMVEHLRLKLRPASSDMLWPAGRSPAAITDYQRIEIDAIPREHEAIQSGTLLSVEDLVVRRIKHDQVKLQDPGDQGIVVRVEFAPGSNVAQGLEIGSRVGVRGEVLYNRRDRMEQIVRDAFPALSSEIGSELIQLPGVPGTYPNPLRMYPEVLGRMLEGRQSYVHGDLHLRNVLVDEWGKGWLIDFARVEKRHNLFDFIKLETYVRLRALAHDDLTFSLGEYVQFEEALAATALGEGGTTCPDNDHLQFAYKVILAIRDIARKYMGRESGFRREYFPALFLYCLAMIKYYQEARPRPTQLAYATACVLSLRIE